jgi:hypothetical protein
MVHVPPLGAHATPAPAAWQTYGGLAPASGFGTHGAVLQQFALDAHAPPAATHAAAAHRGEPVESTLQVSSFVQSPLQQSHEATQLAVCSLQMSPSGLQPIAFAQTPIVAPGASLQVTGDPDPPGRPLDPQQSASFVHKSPAGRQPLAGWQIRTPVGS